MASFYFKGDALFARDVDVHRIARELRKRDQRMASRPDAGTATLPHRNQYLDDVTAMLGGLTHHAARKQADDPDITGWDSASLRDHVWKEAISRGKAFPKDLPQQFGPTWQRQAQAMFAEADARRVRGAAEFVAIVGGPGRGKTLLANHVVHKRGGAVVDVGLSIQNGLHLVGKSRDVLVLDVPAIQPGRKSLQDLQFTAHVKTLSEYRSRVRRPYVFGGFVSALQSFQSWIIEHSQVTVVPTFGSRQALEEVVKRDYCVFDGAGRPRADENWRRAHVVDLDAMTVCSVDGVGLDIEEGRYHKVAG